MRWAAFFLGCVVLAAACVVEDKPLVPDAGIPDGSVEAGGCGFCPVDAPVCLDDTVCVECTAEDDELCEDRSQVCDAEANECVDCLQNSDCTAPDASACNTNTNQCEPCDANTECEGITGLPVCNDDGVCVECTPETEAVSCPEGDSCNPVTNVCSGIQPGTRETCEQCVSDRDCGDEGSRCVPMEYQGERFPDEESGFCLKSTELGGPCVNPYRIVITRTSLSGAESDDYCGINEDLATCPAVLALLNDELCDPANGDLDCPQPSGRCRELPGDVYACTYFCGLPAQCPAEPPANTCDSSGAGGAGGASGDYCGG